jgi:predicted CXXCH cytochrome family protein
MLSVFGMRPGRGVPRLLFALSALLSGLWAFACTDPPSETGDSFASSTDDSASKLTAVSETQDLLAAGLVGSAHDFRQAGGKALDLCSPCHTPHIALGRAPLLDKRPATLAAARPYQARGVELDESTLLCLSCHDGITAVDVFSFAHATRAPTPLGTSWIGTGSLTSHPIGVKYPLTNPTYHPEPAVTSDSRIKLPGGRVQCISCHDPHNTHRIPGMLVRSNDGSRLCLACHNL